MSKALKRYAVTVSRKRRWPFRARVITEVHFYAYSETEVKESAIVFATMLASDLRVRNAAVDIQPTED